MDEPKLHDPSRVETYVKQIGTGWIQPGKAFRVKGGGTYINDMNGSLRRLDRKRSRKRFGKRIHKLDVIGGALKYAETQNAGPKE